eukprot:EG_transcript_13326
MSVVGRSPEAVSLLPVAEGARPARPHPGAWGWWAGRVAAGLLLGVGLAGLLPPAAPLFAAAAPTPVRSVAGQGAAPSSSTSRGPPLLRAAPAVRIRAAAAATLPWAAAAAAAAAEAENAAQQDSLPGQSQVATPGTLSQLQNSRQFVEQRSLDADIEYVGGLPPGYAALYGVFALPIVAAVVFLLAQTTSSTITIQRGLDDAKKKAVEDKAREQRLARLSPKKPTASSTTNGDVALEVETGNDPQPAAGPPPPPEAGAAPSAPAPDSLEAQFQEELRRRAAGGDYPQDAPRAPPPPADDPLDSDDLQGLPRRLLTLARLGATFWLGLGPVVFATLLAVAVTVSLFGTGWIHGGNASKPAPVVFDPVTLEPVPVAARSQVAPPVAP